MTESSDQQPVSMMRRVLPFTTAAVVIALIYVAYIFYSRRQDVKDAEQQAAAKQAADARKVAEMYGGDALKILSFYATAGPIHRGDPVQLCYSVANARQLTIEPEVHDVPVSYSNCVKIAPKKDTTYTLNATDKKGVNQQAVLTIRVF